MTSSNVNLPRISKKERHQLSQVTFLEIPERYLPNEDIKVTYTLNGTWKPSTSDWIGLFRKETEDPHNYITYVYSRSPSYSLEDESVTLTTTFKASYLPQNGSDTYRFCYVTRQGNIRGKSSYFIFANSDEESNTDSDTSSDIVVVERGFGDFDKMQTELDDVKRQNFSLRKSLEEKEIEAKNLSDLLRSAESQIELLCSAVRKQEEERQNANREMTIKLQEEANLLNQKLLESEANRDCLAHQVKAVQNNATVVEEEMSRRLHKAESERDCLQAELDHLQEATATSRFREGELRKALETAHDTTQALIQENHEMFGHQQQLLLAEEQIQRLTKDLNLSEQIRQELLVNNMQFQLIARPRSSSKADHSDQHMESSVEERNENYRRCSVEQSQEMEHYTSDIDVSTSSINEKSSSSTSTKEQKRFLPNAFDRLVKAVLK